METFMGIIAGFAFAAVVNKLVLGRWLGVLGRFPEGRGKGRYE